MDAIRAYVVASVAVTEWSNGDMQNHRSVFAKPSLLEPSFDWKSRLRKSLAQTSPADRGHRHDERRMDASCCVVGFSGQYVYSIQVVSTMMNSAGNQ